jgi:hypothetical protein
MFDDMGADLPPVDGPDQVGLAAEAATARAKPSLLPSRLPGIPLQSADNEGPEDDQYRPHPDEL